MNSRDKSDSTDRKGVLDTLSGMNVSPEKRRWLAPLVHLAYNPLTFGGLFLVNTAAVISRAGRGTKRIDHRII